jgi:hypothetical protein
MTDRRLSMILLAVLVVSAMAVPVVALAVVPERLVTKVLELPWATIWPILVPLLTGAGAAVWSFFVAPVTAKEEPVRPTRVPPPRQGGHAALDALLFIVAAACAWMLHGCAPGLTDTQRRLAVLDTSAATVGGASEIVHEVAGAEARQCLHDDACLDALAERWRPADAAINTIALALGSWLTVEILGTGDTAAAMGAVLELLAELPAVLAPYGVSLGGE